MPHVIWKYATPLTKIATTLTIDMPVGAEVLSADNQYAQLVIWAMCNPDPKCATEPRTFKVLPTGMTFTDPLHRLRFVGTVLFAAGGLVFHVFEVKG